MNWYYLDNLGEVRGPVSEQAVRELIAAGAFTETTPICPEGSQEWTTFAAAFGQDRTTVGKNTSKPVTTSTFQSKIRNLPLALKIGAVIGVVIVGLGVVGLLGLFAVVGAVNQAVKTTQGGQANETAQSAPLDPVASMEAEFGLKLDRDTAYLYMMGYQIGSKGIVETMGIETPQPWLDKLAPSMLIESPDLSAAQKKIAQAGVNDGKAGRPNRLEGIDLQSLELPTIQKTLSEYAGIGNIAKVIELATPSNVNEPDEYSNLPLHRACESGHIEIARLLLSLGARVDLADKGSGRYPIHCAASGGNLDLFILLLKAGARIDQKTNLQESRKHSQMSGLLRSDGFNPDEGSQPIHIAAASGSYSICQYLIKNGILSDAKDNNGLTPLHYATEYPVHGEMKWIAPNAEVIRMFDTGGEIERKFQAVFGPNGSSIRSGGIYLRIFENTGEYAIKNGGAWNAHCLELGEGGTASFMIATVDEEPKPSDIIRAFREPKEGSIYTGYYKLSGDKSEHIKVELQAVPDPRYRILAGTTTGKDLNFTARLETFHDSPESVRTYEGELKFYSE